MNVSDIASRALLGLQKNQHYVLWNNSIWCTGKLTLQFPDVMLPLSSDILNVILPLISDTKIDNSIRENAVFVFCCLAIKDSKLLTKYINSELVALCIQQIPKNTPPRNISDNLSIFRGILVMTKGKIHFNCFTVY